MKVYYLQRMNGHNLCYDTFHKVFTAIINTRVKKLLLLQNTVYNIQQKEYSLIKVDINSICCVPTVGTVSYTHLDVYKRQPIYNSPSVVITSAYALIQARLYNAPSVAITSVYALIHAQIYNAPLVKITSV